MSAKRVHDACEVYDGVPSMHDAKAAQVIGRLYFEGASRVWVEASEQQRSHDAIGRLYQKQHQRQQNRLEAALARHWPELTHYLDLDGITLEELLLSFGSPAQLSAQIEEGVSGCVGSPAGGLRRRESRRCSRAPVRRSVCRAWRPSGITSWPWLPSYAIAVSRRSG